MSKALQKILVTGCTGIVGEGICEYLLAQGFSVYGTSRSELSTQHENFIPVQLDLSDPESISALEPVLKECDAIIHNAGKIPKGEEQTPSEEMEYVKANFLGTLQLLSLIEKHLPESNVFISGVRLASADPNLLGEHIPYQNAHAYDTSKLGAELLYNQYTLQGRLKPAIFRISAPYGKNISNNAVIPRFIKQVKQSENITLWGTGSREQVFTFAEDIGHACRLALEQGKSGVYNITGGSAVSMHDLAKQVIAAFPDSTSEVVFEDKQDPQEGKKVVISTEKAEKELGYSPQYTMAEALKKIANDDSSFFEQKN